MISLSFAAGTIEIHGLTEAALPGCSWDERTRCFRAPAVAYADVVRALVKRGTPFEDSARAYSELFFSENRRKRDPRPYQAEALEAWRAARGRGVVVLPTGAGKSHLATMAIELKKRSTLVVAPTLELVRQWHDLLRDTFAADVGVIGGGDYSIAPLTVTTYDSAYLHMEHLGARFGMVVFDECHHLPGESYALAARFCLAPYRLGLTATPERADGRDRELDNLIGPIIYRRAAADFAGEWLAEYDTERVLVSLSPEEREEYDRERGLYRAFVTKHGIRMSDPSGWGRFLMMSSRSVEGRRALAAYRRQRELSIAAPAKLSLLDDLLQKHRDDPALVFTEDNDTAYRIARRCLIPVITHQTKVSERSAILRGFGEAVYGAIVASKVLNEGVDLPAARVAIVVSGSGSVREHVQRLGRVLRKHGEKRAILYELVTAETGETFTSERRNNDRR